MKIVRFVALCLVAICCVSSGYAGDTKKIVEKLLLQADIQINGTRPWDITVHNEKFYGRMLSQGSLGLGESYMDGWWDSQALDQTMFRIVRANLSDKVKPTWSVVWAYTKACLTNLQDKKRCKKVIKEHYQLGNDLYTAMLDPTMAYSCGYWKDATHLQGAQEAKFDLICRKLGFKKGMKVLDIGCGWGGFSKYAAEKYGVEVVGITLSENQANYAKNICKGLSVEIRIQDYRDVKDSFDRIVEVGMFEHVGEKNYRTFMKTVHRCLKPDGLFMLHTIGRNTSSKTTDPWINSYIFPNGQLPSIRQIGTSIEGLFVMEDWHNFGLDYDKTLMAWFTQFDKNWQTLKERRAGGERFYRMWKYYLLSCAGAFRARDIQLWQVVLSKGGVLEGYQTVR
ncbi:MAG: cfa [Chlamydiia bacterium]|nr:cfa [Chlamydiia bacterium]